MEYRQIVRTANEYYVYAKDAAIPVQLEQVYITSILKMQQKDIQNGE